MKLYLVVGIIDGRTGFGTATKVTAGNAIAPCVNFEREGACDATLFSDPAMAKEIIDDLRHADARHCRVVEIEIPSERDQA